MPADPPRTTLPRQPRAVSSRPSFLGGGGSLSSVGPAVRTPVPMCPPRRPAPSKHAHFANLSLHHPGIEPCGSPDPQALSHMEPDCYVADPDHRQPPQIQIPTQDPPRSACLYLAPSLTEPDLGYAAGDRSNHHQIFSPHSHSARLPCRVLRPPSLCRYNNAHPHPSSNPPRCVGRKNKDLDAQEDKHLPSPHPCTRLAAHVAARNNSPPFFSLL